jgi:trk system potassium uptake protein TrkH
MTGHRKIRSFMTDKRRRRPRITTPQLFAGSFATMIAFGTLGLKILPGIYTGEPLNWLDALFTATSAVCVTGLIVVDTATYFTTAGQAFLLVLIQAGGLGMLTLATAIILSLGRRLSLRSEALYKEQTRIVPHVRFGQLVGTVVVFSILVEGIGALVLTAAWWGAWPFRETVWYATFHSISAFCNAGFSTFSDSLTEFQRQPITLITMASLIVIGGIGFLTLEELRARVHDHQRAPRLSLHARLALVVTGVLLVGGWLVYGVLEWNGLLQGMPLIDRISNAGFMSVTARTAGFNTVDYGSASPGTDYFTILLMSIGGSPGSTAGGMKTTTAALIGLLAWSRLRGYTATTFAHRTVPEETVQRAVGLFVLGFTVVSMAILGYAILDADDPSHEAFLSVMFEAVSAFNTVGLSTGVTASLSDPSRVLTVILMYVGRVGPLAFASAIALAPSGLPRGFRYAREDVIIG